MVGFAGEAQGFDGNGSYVRTATGGGDVLIKTRQALGPPEEPRRQLFGNALVPPQGTRPEAPVQDAAVQDQRRLLQEREAGPERPRRRARAA